MPEISLYPASIFSTLLDFRLTKSSGTILNSFRWPQRGGGQEVRNNPPSPTGFLPIRLSSDNTSPGNLSFCCCAVSRSVKTQSYANQSESGEARVAGSNSDGGGNAPFFMRCSRILSMTACSSIQAITLASLPHFGQIDTSMLNTRFRRCAQVIAWWHCSGVLSSFD